MPKARARIAKSVKAQCVWTVAAMKHFAKVCPSFGESTQFVCLVSIISPSTLSSTNIAPHAALLISLVTSSGSS